MKNTLNEWQSNFWTFAFNIDPALNGGFVTAFKQGDEPYWWFQGSDDGGLIDFDGPAAGSPPDFTGATFKELHQWTQKVL